MEQINLDKYDLVNNTHCFIESGFVPVASSDHHEDRQD